MAGLHFNITAENKNLLRKLEEIKRGVREAAKQMEESGNQAKDAINHAGNKIRFGEYLKKQAYEAEAALDNLTQKITNQRVAVREVESDVKRLTKAYSGLSRYSTKRDSALSELNAAKRALEEEKNTLFGLQTEHRNTRLSVKRLKDELTRYRDEQTQVVGANTNMAASFRKTLAVIGGVAVIKKLGSAIIQVRGELQSAQTAIETLVGKDMAGRLIPQIKELAKISPLTISDMVGAEKMMLGFNIQAEDTIKYLKAISDISMGESGKFNSLTLAFSQMSAAGKLMGQDLNQMINAGFNPLQIIAAKSGKSIAILKEEMSKGAISAQVVQQAFIDATNAGGKFYGMSENASKTINGQLSMMQDALDGIFNELGEKGEGAIIKGIQTTTNLIKNYEVIGKVLIGMIATYGAAKVALIAYDLIVNRLALSTALLKAGIKATTLEQIKLNATMLKNPYALVVLAIGALITTLWALRDSTTAAELAQERYNKKIEEFNEKEKNRKEILESLVSELYNEYTAQIRKMEIVNKLKQEYPVFFKYLLDEKRNIVDSTKAWKAYNEEVAKERINKRKQSANELKKNITDMEKIQAVYNKYGFDFDAYTVDERELFKKYKPNDRSAFNKELEALKIELIKGDKEVQKDTYNEWELGLKKMTDKQINYVRDSLVRQVKMAKNNKHLKIKLNEQIAAIDSEKTARQEEKDNSQTVLQRKIKLTKELSEAEGSLKKLRAPESKASDQEIEAAQKKVDETKAKLKALTGISTKEGNDLLKSQQELSRAIVDQDLKLQEMRLSIMEDGRKKRLKQSELEYKQQKAAIDKEYQDTVQKYKDQHKPVPNSVKTTYEARLGANNAAKVARDNRIEDDYLKERKEHEAALTAYMLSEEDKRKKAIKERYDVEREWAKKQFAGENMTDAEYTNYLGRINTAEVAEGLQELLDKYQDYTTQRKDIERNFDEEIATLERNRTQENAAEVDRAIAEAQKKRKEALSGIDLSEFQDSIDWSGVFGDLDAQTTQALSSLRDKLKNYINKAAKDLKPEDLKVLQDAFKDIDLKISERRPFRELGKDLEEYKAAQAEVNKAQEDLNYVMAGGEIVTGLYMDKTGKMVKQLLTQEEAEKNLTEAQKKRKEAMAAIGNSAAGIAGQIGNVSNAASKIVNVLEEDFGVKVGDNIKGLVEGFNELSDGVSSVVQSAMKGDIAGVIAGVVQSVGGLFKSVTSIFGLGNHKGEEDLKRLEEASGRIVESQKVINSLIEKRIELINKATIAEQKNLAATTEQAIKNQKIYNEQQFKNLQGNWLLDKKGKHNNLTVADLGIGSIEELADFLTGSDRLLALQKQGYSVRDLDKWMEIVNAYQGLEESGKKLAENTAKNLTGITLDDAQSALDEFLKDADASMEDVAGSFENYMRDAMLGIVKQNTLNKALEDWYNHFEQAMDSNGGLDDTEVKNLQQEYENAFTTAQQSYESMLKAAGMSLESDSSGRQATEKGIASMSQDSANELNGNFSALLIYSNKTAENTSSLRESMNYILEIQRAGWSDVRAIKELTGRSQANTDRISELSETIERNTGLTAKAVESINTKGIYLKK